MKYLKHLSIILLISSCASYNALPLAGPSTDLIQISPNNQSIYVVSKAFTEEDCKKYLDRNVIAEGYQPIQLTIHNDSSKNYIFSLNRFSLPTANPLDVAEKVHTSTIGRAVGYGVASLILWPFAIPAIVDGIKSANANKALNQDFLTKAAKDSEIAPYSRMNNIVFVPLEQYRKNYRLSLLDKETAQVQSFELSSY